MKHYFDELYDLYVKNEGGENNKKESDNTQSTAIDYKKLAVEVTKILNDDGEQEAKEQEEQEQEESEE